MTEILIEILLAVSSIIIAGLGYLKMKSERAIRKGVKVGLVQRALLMLNDAAELGVRVTFVTFVDAAKERNKDGKLTPAEMKQSTKLALRAGKNSLLQSAKDFIGDVLHLGEEEITEQIEARIPNALQKVKLEKEAAKLRNPVAIPLSHTSAA